MGQEGPAGFLLAWGQRHPSFYRWWTSRWDDDPTPTDDGPALANDGPAPANDGSAPADDERTSAGDERTPTDDERTPADDERTPAGDERTPTSNDCATTTIHPGGPHSPCSCLPALLARWSASLQYPGGGSSQGGPVSPCQPGTNL